MVTPACAAPETVTDCKRGSLDQIDKDTSIQLLARPAVTAVASIDRYSD